MDGTVAEISYGKGNLSVWEINIKKEGCLFHHLEQCFDEDAKVYSDILYMRKCSGCIVKKVKEIEL